MNISLSGVTVVIVRTQDMLQPLSISTPLPPHPTLITTLITHQTMLSCSFSTCVYTDQCIFLEFNIICGTGSSIADPSLPGCVSYQHSREDASWWPGESEPEIIFIVILNSHFNVVCFGPVNNGRRRRRLFIKNLMAHAFKVNVKSFLPVWSWSINNVIIESDLTRMLGCCW